MFFKPDEKREIAKDVTKGVLGTILATALLSGGRAAGKFVGKKLLERDVESKKQELMNHPELADIPQDKRQAYIEQITAMFPKLTSKNPDLIASVIKHRHHYGAYAADLLATLGKLESAQND